MKTIQYMGSKGNLLRFIEESVDDFLDKMNDNECKVFFDAFCGSGRVAYHFKDKYKIYSNDKQYFSKVITDAYLCNIYDSKFYQPYIDALNDINIDDYEKWIKEKKIDGWFVDNYSTGYNDGVSVGQDGNPKIWLTNNAKKIEMVRYAIENLYQSNQINYIQYCVLLLSLILSTNKISNVVGHQNGYLKKWCQNALKDFTIENPKINSKQLFEHVNLVGDIYDNIKDIKCDIAYFDPPYGTNNKNLVVATRYSSFYHLWNTLIVNNRPILFGKAGKPIATKGYTEPLEKNIKKYVIPKFIRLIEEVNAKYVSFSYSNKSLLTVHDFRKIYELAGCDMNTFKLYISKHKSNNQDKLARKEGRYIERNNDNDVLIEYLFIAKKKAKHQRITKENEKKDEEDINEVNDWLEISPDDYSLPNEDWIINK